MTSVGGTKRVRSWEAVPISKNVVAPFKPPSITVSRTTPALTDLGDSVSLMSDEEETAGDRLLRLSSMSSLQAAPYKKQRPSIPLHTSASTAASSTTKSSSRRLQFGVPSEPSSSKAQAAAASRRSSTTHSLQPTFTLSQSRLLFGSTATAASVFSSLTSIRASLLAKSSSSSWMDIATQLSTKEASRALRGIASCLRQTTHSSSGTTQQSDDDSSEEDTSDSQAEEDNTLNFNSDSEVSEEEF